MTFPELNELATRLVMTYLAQCMQGIIMFFIFRHFSKIYVRRFLRSWSRSWIAFALYALSSALILFTSDDEQDFLLRTFLSLVAQLGCYLQIFLILMGTYQLVYERPIKRRLNQIITGICILLAFATVLVLSHDPTANSERLFIRLGSRSFIPACGFLFAGFVVWSNRKFTQGFGQKLLASAFILFSMDQFFDFFRVLAFFFGKPIPLPSYFGLLDLLLISLMGLGMVMWLLENEREKLNKANKELDTFLYSTSHDLRAPIASILGLTYLGKLELEEERARTFMGMIEDRITKLDLVIADILSLARTKKFDVKIENVDFNEILEDTIVDVKFNKGASSISLLYEKNILNAFFCDQHQLKIILSNLISNAIKYHNLNQPSPYIKVIFSKWEDRIEIAVEDNGQGIPAEGLGKVFDMFYRASTTTEGTGLGLYIVQEALLKINGSITVKSELGKGSTFTILLAQGYFGGSHEPI